MAEIVTLELPETLAQRAKEIAALTNRRIEDVLLEWIDRASTELAQMINKLVRDLGKSFLPNFWLS